MPKRYWYFHDAYTGAPRSYEYRPVDESRDWESTTSGRVKARCGMPAYAALKDGTVETVLSKDGQHAFRRRAV